MSKTTCVKCAYFLYFSPSNLQTTPPHQTPSPSTPYRHIPLHTYSPAPKGVVKYDALPFFLRKIIHFQLFPVSLLTNHLSFYIIYEHTFYYSGQLPGTRHKKRRLPPQNRSAPGKNSKGVVKRDSLCHKEGFSIAGNSGNEG